MSERKTKPELYEEIRQLKRKLRRAEAEAAKRNVLIPHELKTLSIDTEKKIFQINGEEFGRGCTGFTITCNGYQDFDIRVEVDAVVKFVSIRQGECVTETEHPVRESWYSVGEQGTDD